MKEIIKAIRREDIIAVLKEYQVDSQFNQGQLQCHKCHKVLTIENIGGIMNKGKEILLFCDSVFCEEIND